VPIRIDAAKCNGCNLCVDLCPEDVLIPKGRKSAPIVRYPEECFHCGACIMDCPKHCIELDLPLPLKPKFLKVT